VGRDHERVAANPTGCFPSADFRPENFGQENPRSCRMFVQPGSRGKPAGPRPSDKSGKAAPAKLGDLLSGKDSSPHRVQINRVHHAQESGGVFYERGLIAALKKMSAFGPKPVEANGKGICGQCLPSPRFGTGVV
jgi:hypothetical protein